MFLTDTSAQLVATSLSNPYAASAAIIIGTFILEDATTILVGIAAADHRVGPLLALLSLYAGILLGDLGLYGTGRSALLHSKVRSFLEHRHAIAFRPWLEKNLGRTVFVVRFIPGLRLPTYMACGFFEMPLKPFLLYAGVAVSIWTTFLFFVSYAYGALTADWLVHTRWLIAAAFVGFAIFVSRKYLRSFIQNPYDANHNE